MTEETKTPVPGTPPPVPEKKSVVAGVAATASLVLPVLAIGLSVCVKTAGLDWVTSDDSLRRTSILIIGGISVGLVLLGVVAGILALATRMASESKVQTRALIGIVLNAGILITLLSLGVAVQKKAEIKKENLASIEKARKEMEVNTRETVEKEGFKSDPAKLDNFRQAVDKASREMTGPEGNVMKAGSAYLARFQMESAAFNKALTNFMGAKILSVGELKSVEEIAQRRALVKEFVAANNQMRTFLGQAEKTFEDELIRNNVNEKQRAKEMDGFRVSSRPINGLVQQIREKDGLMADDALEMLDLLETSWGAWDYIAATQMVLFRESTNSVKYREIMDRIRQAANDEKNLQMQLVDVQRAANTRRAGKK